MGFINSNVYILGSDLHRNLLLAKPQSYVYKERVCILDLPIIMDWRV